MSKSLATLALAFSLFLLTPVAHAQSNACSTLIPTGGGCILCPSSCVAGDTCNLSGICESISGSSGTGSLGSTGNTQSTGSLGSTGNSNTSSGSSGTTLLNPLNAGTSLPALLAEILAFVVKLGTVVIVLMVVYVGFKFVMARGEPGAISEARQALLWTVVGALILLGAQAIASAIQATAQAL